MFECPHCQERAETWEGLADHLMEEHDYPGMWESEAEKFRVRT